MNDAQYQSRLYRLEVDRRKLIAEMEKKPFGDRVMSDARESELDAIECELLDNPPIIGRSPAGEPFYAGKGLTDDPEDTNRLLQETPPASFKVIPQSEWPAYIEGKGGEKQLSVLPYVEHILNQGSVGSCAGEGISGCIMAAENLSGQTPTKLNGYFPYHWSSGGSDRGSTLSANIRVTRERGVASEEIWPRSNGFRRSPSQEALHDAKQHRPLDVEKIQNWDEFGTALLLSFPVYFGYTGHAIYGAELVSPVRLKYPNSWGRGFGENGVGTLNMRRILWSYGVWVVRVASENRQ